MKLPALTVLCVSLLGCAVAPDGGRPINGRSPAGIGVERLSGQSPAGRCDLRLGVVNGMTTSWSGFSYHVVFRGRAGQSVGESRGIPMQFMDPRSVVTASAVASTSCEDVAGVEVLYFGYYPSNGGGQIQIRPAIITTGIR